MSRVVLLDPAGDTGAVRAALAGHPQISVTCAQRIPAGPGVIALLVGPEFAIGELQLAQLPDIRIVAATATGFDHLDLKAIATAGAWATHCPGYCDQEVAEHAIAFTLDLLRGVTLLDRAVRAGRWSSRDAEPQRVAGSVLGVVGLGRIGRQVAVRAKALGMRVIASDPLIAAHAAGEAELLPLTELLQIADVVTLHAPLTAATRAMIDADALAAMRPGTYLINCARAALIDHRALGNALCSGRLGGCALDVLPVEPPAANEPARGWPRTLLNPHAAWYSPESATAPYRLAGEAVAAVLDGREPRGALGRPVGQGDDASSASS